MINNFLRLSTNGNITRAGYATTFHVTGRRISKENMHENYMKMKEKCQCKLLNVFYKYYSRLYRADTLICGIIFINMFIIQSDLIIPATFF